MQKGSNLAKKIKISSLAYTGTTAVFFALSYYAILQMPKERTDILYKAILLLVNILLYVELLGYFVVLAFIFLFFYQRGQIIKRHQEVPAEYKFPLWTFLLGFVCFLLFMNFSSMVLS